MFERIENFELDLGLVGTVHLEVLSGDTDFSSEYVDRFRSLSLRNLDIGRNVFLANESKRFDETLLRFLEKSFGREYRVLHQHGDGHGSYSSGYGSDMGSGLNC